MAFKDWFYIALILVAGICGYMLSPKGQGERITQLEMSIAYKEHKIATLKRSVDSLTGLQTKIVEKWYKDSLNYQNVLNRNKITIQTLTRKTNEIHYKNLNDRERDSIIVVLYGTK